jgi:hypothetical protein
VVKNIAAVLDTIVGYLLRECKKNDVLKDAELLQQFKAVEQFSDDDKTVVKKLIDAFILLFTPAQA